MGDLANPGYLAGYKVAPEIGKAIWNPIAEDLTPRIYKYVSPSGYFNSKMSRMKEAKNIAKSFITREKIDINDIPEWVKNGGIGPTAGQTQHLPWVSNTAET